MNITIQKCDKCGNLNTAADKNWLRSYGVWKGAPALLATPQNNSTPKDTQVNTAAIVYPKMVDLCPDCVVGSNMLDLVEITKGNQKATPAATTAPTGAAKTATTATT